MEDPFTWMIVAFAVVGVATMWQLFLRGEVVGEVTATRLAGLDADGKATLRVKRTANSKGVPTVRLHVSVPLAAAMSRFTAREARRLSQLLDEAIEDGIGGCQVERLRDDGGELFVVVVMAVNDTVVRARLATAGAKRLAALVRVAAEPGRTLAQARWNASRAKTQ